MITQPAKVFLPLVAIGGVAAVVYAIVTGDHVGVSLWLVLAVAALAGAVVITTARDGEFVAPVPADAPAPGWRPIAPVRLPGGPAWPAIAALGAGVSTAALVIGPAAAVPGIGLLAFATVGWIASVASDRTRRVTNLMPIGIPVVGLLAIASVMFFTSRILLALPVLGATWTALGIAVLILGFASLVAYRPAMSSKSLLAGLVVLTALMVVGGTIAGIIGQREIHAHHTGPDPIRVSSIDIAFDTEEITLPANEEVVISYDNKDSVPHNIAIYRNPEFSGLAIFQGAVITSSRIDYRFTAPAAGTYWFRCDIHPLMQGVVTVA
ncbi:MAG: cupredoxin domain-containing protein [Actinomycetota bacterium]